MKDLEKVQIVLARIAPEAICDDCIADKLKLSVRQRAYRKTYELSKRRGYDRRVAQCTICKRTDKKVIRHA